MIQDTLPERLPIRELKYLLSIDYDTFKLYGKSIYKNESDRKNHFDQLKTFCSKSLKTNGVTEHNYYYSKNTPDNVGGRIFSKNGVQGLSKKIRGFIMKHTTDIDMKNAHPVILNYLCKLHSIHAPSLEYYINNRESIIGNGADRENLKSRFLEALNNNKINYKVKDTFFRKFDNEMKFIQKTLCTLSDYESILKSVPNEKKDSNLYCSCLNHILCKYENLILNSCKKVLHEIILKMQ